MSDDRRSRVLRAIVEDYVSTNEPVGSKALVERHGLGVSPATIRNDMAQLEQDGLIAQPHTSAGRIPTDKGYRMFVDRIDEVKPLSAAEKRAISRFIEGPIDLDDMLARTVRVLSGLTRQVAVIQYPSVSRDKVRHIELVGLTPQRVLTVLITDTGQVHERMCEVGSPVDEVDLAAVRERLNRLLHGVEMSAVDLTLPTGRTETAGGELLAAVTSVLRELTAATREDRVIMAGTANLARAGGDLGEHIGPLLEAFEEQVVMLKLLSSMAADPEEITVRIGRENQYESFATTSVVSTDYGADAHNRARLAVLGPTRMDYPTTMAAVRAVARYVSVILQN